MGTQASAIAKDLFADSMSAKIGETEKHILNIKLNC